MKSKIKSLLKIAAILLLQTPNLQSQNNCLSQKTLAIGRDSTPNDPHFWNSLDWWDTKTGSHNLPDAPTRLEIKVTDLCGGTPDVLTYQLLLDLDGDGKNETSVSGDSSAQAGFVQFGNLNGFGSKRQFDFRPVPAAVFYKFSIEQSVSGNVRTGRVVWRDGSGTPALPQLPYGRFGIVWFCGGKSLGGQKFLVQDALPPKIFCLSGVSGNIQSNNKLKIWASDLVQFAEDIYTPPNGLAFSIRKKGKATGFPLDLQGNPVGFVEFGCDELGERAVEIWGKDFASNTAFCQTTVVVGDLNNYCKDSLNGRTTCLETEIGQPIQNVSLQLSGTPPGLPSLNLWVDASSSDGCFEIKKWFGGVPFSNFYGISPVKDTEPLNGVDSTDLLLLTQHLLGIKPLDSPYKLIAADINRSGSVTSTDAVELKKLLDGIYSNFPNNTSWRFIDKNFMFANPANPFLNNFDPPFMLTDSIVRMIGIKVGDLNNSADPSLLWQSDERTAAVAFENGFRVFPNPTSSEIFIEKTNVVEASNLDDVQPQPAQFEIFDALGRSLRRGELVEPRTRLDVSEFPAGQFFVKIFSGGAVSTLIFFKK